VISLRAAGTSVVLAATLVLAGCATDSTEPTTTPTPSGIALPGDFSGSGPGTLKSATKLPTVDRRLIRMSSVAARIIYESQSGVDGSTQKVSASVFAPTGTPPEGGWPIVAYAHGTTGVLPECAPSLSTTLLGTSEAVRILLSFGYVVVMTDYQGLGLDETYHPYLDATTAGNNTIDSVRAARKLLPEASNRWLGLGVSQGGAATWAANELAATYGSGLDLVGTVSASPSADITGLADLAAAGTLTADQTAAMAMVLWGLKKAHPDLNLDDYRRGVALENWDLLTECSGDSPERVRQVVEQIPPDDFRPATPAAVETLRSYLSQMSLPKAPTSAPMLVMHGDADLLVPQPWTEGAVVRACGMGDVITSFIAEGRGHGDFDPVVALDWIRQRFEGVNADNTCNLEGGPSIRRENKPWHIQ
jgi:acetyl esterase/lipase